MNNQRYSTACVFLGLGLGGLINTIMLSDVLQFHQMFSANLPTDSLTNTRESLYWTGLEEILLLVCLTIGILLLWLEGKTNNERWRGKTLAGLFFIGWGIFNLTEGIIAHHVLAIHHVYEKAGLSEYDYLYLAIGIVFMLFGTILVYLGKRKRGYYQRSVRAHQPVT